YRVQRPQSPGCDYPRTLPPSFAPENGKSMVYYVPVGQPSPTVQHFPVGSYANPYTIAVAGSYVFITNHNASVTYFLAGNIPPATLPTLSVGHSGSKAIAAAGSYVFVADEATNTVYYYFTWRRPPLTPG
ncbi:hypothetical protein, partial [Candidatus Entotheonella palauensis]|uniref:hypothetical protein n=1 Tax=Candidatus Entotheonella palauensis TaxID=93172 RepID=UPI001C4DEDC4